MFSYVVGGFKAINELKLRNPKLKTLLTVGGWSNGGANFSEVCLTPERRFDFVKNTISFLREHDFDGIEISWLYPGTSREGGRVEDKENFELLVEVKPKIEYGLIFFSNYKFLKLNKNIFFPDLGISKAF